MDTRRAGLRELQDIKVVSAERSVVDDPFVERRTRVLYRLHEARRAEFREVSPDAGPPGDDLEAQAAAIDALPPHPARQTIEDLGDDYRFGSPEAVAGVTGGRGRGYSGGGTAGDGNTGGYGGYGNAGGWSDTDAYRDAGGFGTWSYAGGWGSSSWQS